MKAAVSAVLILLSTSASAMEDQFYLKGKIGSATYKSDYSADDFPSSLGYAYTFGYRVNEYFALEGGRSDLGEMERESQGSFDRDINESGGFTYAREDYEYYTKVRTSFRSFSAGAALSMDVGDQFEAQFRLGMHQWCVERSASGFQRGTMTVYDSDGIVMDTYPLDRSLYSDRKDTDHDPYYGVGFSWKKGMWSLGVEHTVYEVLSSKYHFSAMVLGWRF